MGCFLKTTSSNNHSPHPAIETPVKSAQLPAANAVTASIQPASAVPSGDQQDPSVDLGMAGVRWKAASVAYLRANSPTNDRWLNVIPVTLETGSPNDSVPLCPVLLLSIKPRWSGWSAEQSKNNNPEGSQIDTHTERGHFAAAEEPRRLVSVCTGWPVGHRNDPVWIRWAVYFNFIALNCSQITDNLINYKHAGANANANSLTTCHDRAFAYLKSFEKHNSRSISTVKLDLYHWW